MVSVPARRSSSPESGKTSGLSHLAETASLIVASAPGKLFLSGEYAVLEGAPAIACAVERRAHVRLLDSKTQERTQAARWREAAEDLIIAQGFGESRADAGLAIETRALHTAGGTKYGLGSSAAVAVAVSGVLLAARGALPALPEQLRVASAVHRSRQGSGGSGADVVASLYGGVVAVTAGRVKRLKWPDGLACAVLWTGRSADTALALDRYRAVLRGGSRRAREALQRLAGKAEAVEQAWHSGSEAALEALASYGAAWQEFDQVAGLGIYSAAHRELLDLARSADCFYKPSGAGGGDCGIAVSRHPEALKRMRRAAAGKGYRPLDMELAAQGLTVTPASG